MKKTIIAVLTASMMLTACASAIAAVPAEELVAKGIIEGYEDGELHLDRPLTRAQAITMIMRSTGFDDSKWYKSEVPKFDDMPISNWASGYVYKAASLGMIDGVTDDKYQPDSNVTYEQAVKMIVGVLGYAKDDFSYPDDYLKKAEDIGILKGVSASIGDELTREQFVTLLYNATECETADGGKLDSGIMSDDDEELNDYVERDYAMVEEAGMPAPGAAAGGAKRDGVAAKSVSGGHTPDTVLPGTPDIPDYPEQIAPGQLTAGRWSDFENYDFWEQLMDNQEYLELQQKWEIPIDIDRVSPDPDESEDILDLMFTIDTTGSMGDELQYIKEELKDVVLRLDTNVRLSCNYYRDVTDSYVVKSFPFTTNIDKVVSQISKQYASGGGDYEEAVDAALLDSVNEHDWSESARSRLLFLVLDAPPHFTQEVTENIRTAVDSAVEKGIHIIPVASSGVDKNTEFFLRSLALATGGTYVFLTDDSGIGYSHIEPTIGDYEVEYLNELLLEIIKEYIGQDYDIQINQQINQQTDQQDIQTEQQ